MKVIRYNVQPRFVPETMSAIADSLERFLHRINYKDGWEWVIMTEPGAVHVSVKWPVIDVANGLPGFVISAGRTTFHDQKQLGNECSLLHEAYAIIQDAEVHELREWFKFDGKKIYDPHAAVPAQTPDIPELPQPAPTNCHE